MPFGKSLRSVLAVSEGERDRLVETHLRAAVPGRVEGVGVELLVQQHKHFSASSLLVEGNNQPGFLVQRQRRGGQPCRETATTSMRVRVCNATKPVEDMLCVPDLKMQA